MIFRTASWPTLNQCLLCRAPAPGHLFCGDCLNDLPVNDRSCGQCALPLLQPGLCPDCLRHPPAFTRTVAAFRYEPPVDRLINHWKHRCDSRPLAHLGNILCQQLQLAYQQDDWPQSLLPVPLHPLRLIRRGFHQTADLAGLVGRVLKLPTEPLLLSRSRRGHSQQGLDQSARRANLRGQFSLNGPVAGRHLALVDDVMTTGTTAGLLAELLTDAGARRVDVWLLARTP